jgi:hypothetical protein
MMATWTSAELNKIGKADELQIAPRRPNGTLYKPVTIWVVRHGEDLYVRSWRGHEGAWFRGAEESHEGRISSEGIERDVTFADVDAAENAINDEIDAAYRTKYQRYGARYVDPMLASEARAATLRLVPR